MFTDTFSIILASPLLIAGGFLISYLLRFFVHQQAFCAISKTRKKIIRVESFIHRLFMTYATKYSNPGRARWCLICYYTFSISLILIISLHWIVLLSGGGVGGIWNVLLSSGFWSVLWSVFCFAPFLSIFSILLPGKNKKK